MKDRLFWVREWVPELLRQLVPDPVVELRSEPSSYYVHGTFFYDETKQFVLVQVLHTVELATHGEPQCAPKVTISIDRSKLNVSGARVLWPRTQDLPVASENGKTRFALPALDRYMALYLKVA